MTKYLLIGKANVAAFAKSARKFLTGKEEGASLAEYGLLLALIAVVCIGGMTLLGSHISTLFTTIAGTI